MLQRIYATAFTDKKELKQHLHRLEEAKKRDHRKLGQELELFTFDERVGLSHTTGEVTHHIGPDVDAERDLIARDLQNVSRVQQAYDVPGFHKVLSGRNGGGDEWRTDGNLTVVVLKP